MNQRPRPRMMTRRTFIGGAGATGASFILAGKTARGQAIPTPVITGDCRPEPGVQLLAEWNLGISNLSPIDVLPPLTWTRYYHTTIPVTFLYPPDWNPTPLWADSFSQTGMPLWVHEPMMLPQLTVERIVSPNRDAAFEFVTGTISNVALTPAQAAHVAEQGLLGDQITLTPLCTFEHEHPLVSSWFHGMYAGSGVLVSEGWPIPQTSVFGPSTILNYYTMVGPREQFEMLMRTVFIPILYQLSGSAGGETPTPVP